tara:strand:+ start:77 stop:493 length:417 start_codon:yes stop_codon:yes gene_type:complete
MEKDIESLEFEFSKALSLNYAGSNTHFFDFMDDRALFIDDDQTNILNLSEMRDHLDFHGAGVWESMEIKHYDIRSYIVADTGVVTSNYTIRGKPVSTGFRIRHGVCSASCYFDEKKGWKAMSIVLGPMISYIRNASPT